MGLFNRLPAHPVYNTRAVVQRTGVPADTFRAWERRYGVPHPKRTEGNQRLYSDRDVATIAWLRDQTRSGLTISQAVQLLRAIEGEFDPAVAAAGARRDGPTGTADARMERFAERVVATLIDYDAQAAERVVEEALALLPVEDVCLHVLQPALYEIGDRWQRGEVTVSAEHFASAFVIRKLGSLFNLSQPDHGRGPVIAACLEGELHEVGLLLTCLFLSRRGVRIVYLGPNLPLDDLIDTIDRLRPPLVILSASTVDTGRELAGAVRRIQSAGAQRPVAASPPTIGFGGRIFREQPELRHGIDGVYLGDDAEEAGRVVDTVLDDLTLDASARFLRN